MRIIGTAAQAWMGEDKGVGGEGREGEREGERGRERERERGREGEIGE